MITRVTDNIKFNMITSNLFNVSSDYGTLMEKLSTQKNINRPSDDPIGINDILDFRVVTASIEQYKTNITDSDIWLNLSEANISGLRKIADQAKAIAIEESGASGSPETRKTSAETLKALIDEALSLLNAQNGDNYIFAGSATDVQPFSNTYSAASRSISAASNNTYAGTLTTSGTYIPTENQSYVVRFVGAGAPGAATYQISTDGGATWGATATLAASGVISNIGGASVDIDLTFSAGTFAANDTFTVNATAAGYYQGNNDDLYAVVGKNNDVIYNITGAEAFTGQFAEALVKDSSNIPTRMVKGSISNTAGGSAITGATVWNAIDGANVQNNTSIFISGKDHDGNTVGPDTFTIIDAATGTVQDLLDQIEASVGGTVTASIDTNGRITVADYSTGESLMKLSLTVTNPSGGSLNFGMVDLYDADTTIVLTRGATADSWVTTVSPLYPDMVIDTPQTTQALMIDLNNDGTNDISVNLTGTWSQGDTISLDLKEGSTIGYIPASFTGADSIDLLSTLNALKDALDPLKYPKSKQSEAVALISAQVDNLVKVETQMLQYETQAGAKMKSLKVTSGNHDSINLQITNMLADIENADLTKLITQFQMKQIAMQASYNMASQIGKMTIMDYI